MFSMNKIIDFWFISCTVLVLRTVCQSHALLPLQVTRQVAQCKCAKRFQVEQIGENKYRVSAPCVPAQGLVGGAPQRSCDQPQLQLKEECFLGLKDRLICCRLFFKHILELSVITFFRMH